jgi:hypothetical protein
LSETDCVFGCSNVSASLPIAFSVFPLLLSIAALVWLIMASSQSRSQWLILLLASGNIVVFAFLAGTWAFTSYYLRYVFPGLFVLVAICLYFRPRCVRSGARLSNGKTTVLRASAGLFFLLLNSLVFLSYCPSAEDVDVEFPLRSGSYYVLQGGQSAVTNPFHAMSGDVMAIDIVKLNRFGNRASGIAPRALNAYEIFAETLYSPCSGSIEKVRDGLPDNLPGQPDTELTEGNYILLRCADADVFMAHLKSGTIKVLPGEHVSEGQPLAEVGNSGNSLEPHLHISATSNGSEAGLRFDGRSLSINSVIRRKQAAR